MADKNVNIILSATDATSKAFQSVTSNLNSLAKTAAGTALGIAGFNGISNLFGGITSTVFGMNQSLDATRRSGTAMLDSIRSSAGGTAEAFSGSAKQVQDWGRQLREIRERESDGLANFADQTRKLNAELQDLLSGGNIAKRQRDEQDALTDLAQDHAERLADIQKQVDEEKAKGIYVDGILYRQGNQQRLADLQTSIDRENREYQQKLDRRKREYDEDLAALRASNDARITEIRRSLDQQRTEETRFTRDIREAYADLVAAKNLALGGGGSAGGLAAGTGAVITYRKELQNLKISSKEVFDQFDVFFKAEGVRSPFNISDIQRAGAQLVQYSGGSLKNMQQIVQMAESLASSPAVAGFSGAERMDLAIRALSEAYNGQFTSMERIFNISGAGFANLQKGTFTTTQFTDGLNQSLQQSGINYGLVDQYAQTLDGSWGNLVETGKLLAATIASPVYDWFAQKLQEINRWVTNNQGTINAWAADMRTNVADFLKNEVQPKLEAFLAWFQSPQAKKDMQAWGGNIRDMANALRDMAIFGGQVVNILNQINKPNLGQNAGSGLANWLNGKNSGGAVGGFFSGLSKLLAFADGGTITKPTILSDAATGQPYGIMAEAGPEHIVPAGRMGQSGAAVNIDNVHIYNQVDLNAFAERLSWRLS